MYSTNKNYFKKIKIYTSKIILHLFKRNQQKILNSTIKSTYFVIDPFLYIFLEYDRLFLDDNMDEASK